MDKRITTYSSDREAEGWLNAKGQEEIGRGLRELRDQVDRLLNLPEDHAILGYVFAAVEGPVVSEDDKGMTFLAEALVGGGGLQSSQYELAMMLGRRTMHPRQVATSLAGQMKAAGLDLGDLPDFLEHLGKSPTSEGA